jgi:antitoxin component of MazEF toxin-antitoxin module
MRQVVQVRRWSNSLIVTITSNVAKQLGWRVGQVVQLDIQGDCLVVQPVHLPKGRALAPASELTGLAVTAESDEQP